MKRLNILTFLLILLLILPSCKKEVRKMEVVFLLPHEIRSQIWQSFVKAGMEEFSDTTRYNLHFYQTYRGPEPFFYHPLYEQPYTSQLRNAMMRMRQEKVEPDLIITYGDYISHCIAQYDDPYLKEKPILCVGVTYPQWKDLLVNMPNVVVMESEPEVKKNIDFIQEMGFSNYVVTVMDSTYIDDHIRDVILKEIGDDPEHYVPNLHLEQIDRIHKKLNRDPRVVLVPMSLMEPEKNKRNPEIPGALDIKWVFNTNQQSTSFLHLKDDPYAHNVMTYNIGPFFAMTPEYFNLPLINALNYNLGGYMTTYPSMMKQIHPVVDKLLSGTSPSQIPWSKLKKDYWLDWRLAKNIHPYASDFPKGVKFVNLPRMHKSRTVVFLTNFLVFVLIVLFIIYAIIVPIVMSKKQKKQRKLLLDKAKEAEISQKKVEFTLSNIEAYVWRLLPDKSLKFSPSFYRDFHIPEGQTFDYEALLQKVEEPGRSKLQNYFFIDDFHGETDFQLMVHLSEESKPRAIYMYTISVPRAESHDKTISNIKAGFFYFNDDVYQQNEELRQAYRLSEEVSEKEHFLATMNDAFKNPVRTIVKYSRALVDKFDELTPEQKTEYEEKVLTSNEELLALLDEVMGDTIQNREQKHVQISLMDVASLMESIYIYQSVDAGNNDRIEFLPGPDKCQIEGNRSVLNQIINNIISSSCLSCQGKIGFGWAESTETEVILFINNSVTDIASYRKIIESIGGTITVFNYPDSPARIEIAFHKIHGGGKILFT
ncbi:MAG: hypothetical protein MSA02_01745 [Bacteroidales bacterium]|nr:hypothetical protein [Bacteroidales bacterium]